MSAKILTVEAAKAAKFDVIDNGRGTQAVHDAVVAMQANRRSGTACAKKKDEVAYSGKKPWRQKGTGRARAGGKNSPLWRGGGVVFGPRPRDYSKKTPKSVKRLAFRKGFSERILAGDVLVVDGVTVAEPKTKAFVSLVRSHTDAAKVLVIATGFDEATYLAARNVESVLLATADEVNTENILAFHKILVTMDALQKLAERTSNK